MLAGVAQRYKGELLTEKARGLLRDLRYQAAVEQSTRAIQADPSNFYPYLYQGEAYRIMALQMQIPPLQTAFFEKAATSFRNGLNLFPQDSNVLIKLGRSLDGAHRVEEAGEAYLSALRWDPTFGYNYAHYAAHLEMTGQPEAAKKCREAAGKLGTPDAKQIGKAEKEIIRATDSANPNPQ